MKTRPKNYPLIENTADTLHAASGRRLADITTEAALAGKLSMADTQISAATLRAQAEIARLAGYVQQAANLIRAAELMAVPNFEVLLMYNHLRPGRATREQLSALAETLEKKYHAPECARFVREALAVYEARDLLQK